MYKVLKVKLSYKGLTKSLPFKNEVDDIEKYRKELIIKHEGLIESLSDGETKPKILIDYEEIGN